MFDTEKFMTESEAKPHIWDHTGSDYWNEQKVMNSGDWENADVSSSSDVHSKCSVSDVTQARRVVWIFNHNESLKFKGSQCD
jgi:hypothetical protein